MRRNLIIGILMLSILLPNYGHAGSVSDEKGFARNGRLEEYDKVAKGANSVGIDRRGYYRDSEYRHEVKAGMSQDEWETKQEARAKQSQWDYEHRDELEKKAQERPLGHLKSGTSAARIVVL